MVIDGLLCSTFAERRWQTLLFSFSFPEKKPFPTAIARPPSRLRVPQTLIAKQ